MFFDAEELAAAVSGFGIDSWIAKEYGVWPLRDQKCAAIKAFQKNLNREELLWIECLREAFDE